MMKIFKNIGPFIICLAAFLSFSCAKSAYLTPTFHLDADNPLITSKVKELIKNESGQSSKIKVLYEFVRDSIDEKYNDKFIASEILKDGYGYCYNKSILFAAMCRAAGTPAGISFDKVYIKNYYNEGTKVYKDIHFYHGIVELYLNGNWHKYDITGNIKRWRIWAQDDSYPATLPLQFAAGQDVVFLSAGRICFERTDLNFADWNESIDKMIADFNNF